jgi:hypothetical protein
MPVDFRYFSALPMMLRGSREYGSLVIGSYTLQISDSVGYCVNGSSFAVVGSGTSSMSDALIGCQPRIDEPSRPKPSSNESSLSCWIVTVVCCQMPGRSMNFRSTNLTPFFSANLRTSLGVMRGSFGI